jgi:N-acetylneuraminate lyase
MSMFEGAWPALATPFTARGDVNTEVLRRLVEYLIGKGIGGFYVCGTTGEGVGMSVEERKLVAETVIDQAAGRVPSIVHVGAISVRDAAALAKHAADAGANGVASIIPPFYNNVDSIFDYFSAIAAAVPDTPLFTYIFGGPADAVALQRSLMKIPTVCGGKYTGPNMHEFRQIIDLREEHTGRFPWTVFSGMDEECLFASMFGSSGNIGSTLNYMPGAYREIHACRKSGDFARATELQLQANDVTRILISYGFIGAMKELLCEMGFDCGQSRPPHRPLPAEKRAAFFAEIRASKFAELAAL